MLGKSPLSTVSISGGSFGLVVVPLYMAATGAFLTFGGSANAGTYIPMSASGNFITFGGSAPGIWLQNISASGNFLTFGGSADLRLAGRPFRFRMIARPYTFSTKRDSYSFKMIARPYSFRGYR